MKDYRGMTQEELDQKLAEFIKKNYEKGVFLLDRYYRLKTLKDYKYFNSVHMEDPTDMVVIVRRLDHMPDFKRLCKGMNDKTEPLIRTYDHYIEVSELEPVHDDFISRADFINKTGIFVSPEGFEIIYDTFVDSGLSVDEFVSTYEDEYSVDVCEIPLNGVFKYEFMDLCFYAPNDIRPEEEEPNLWEVMDYVVKNAYSEEQDLSNMLNAERAANREAKRIIADLQERLAKYETDAEV